MNAVGTVELETESWDECQPQSEHKAERGYAEDTAMDSAARDKGGNPVCCP